ncbi:MULTISPECIES: hypothetical protein [Methylobacterium]|nr:MULTISPECIES: hypothetical protein [Methylobacterium]
MTASIVGPDMRASSGTTTIRWHATRIGLSRASKTDGRDGGGTGA